MLESPRWGQEARDREQRDHRDSRDHRDNMDRDNRDRGLVGDREDFRESREELDKEVRTYFGRRVDCAPKERAILIN
jgi:hypothetical protein